MRTGVEEDENTKTRYFRKAKLKRMIAGPEIKQSIIYILLDLGLQQTFEQPRSQKSATADAWRETQPIPAKSYALLGKVYVFNVKRYKKVSKGASGIKNQLGTFLRCIEHKRTIRIRVTP